MGRQKLNEHVQLDETNQRASPKNWKTLSKFVVFGFLTCEAIKMIAIRSVDSDDVVAVSLGFLGSLVLLCLSALLKICFDDIKTLKARIVKEAIILSSLLLFLFTLQRSYFKSDERKSNQLEADSETLTVYGMLSVILLMENLLNLGVVSQIITVFYFFIYSSFRIFEDSEESNAGVYLKVISPGVYLIVLTFLKFKNQIPTTTRGPEKRVEAEVEKPMGIRSERPWLKFIDESVFTCNRNGRIRLLNHFFLRNLSFTGENDLLGKIEDLKLTQEEKLDAYDEIKDYNFQEKEEQKSDEPQTSPLPKKRTYNKIAVNVGVDPMENLGSLLKSTLLSIAGNEFKEPKLLKYYGQIRPTEQTKVSVQIKVFVLPNYEYPMVVVLKNGSYKKENEMFKTFETSRNSVMSTFYNELSRILELSKSLIRVERPQSTFSSLSNETVDKSQSILIQPLFQSFSLISRLIEDNIEYSCLRVHDLKFRYTQCNIKSVIESAISLFRSYAKMKKVDLIFQYHKAHEYVINTDQDRLFQLLIQLIYNSLKYTRADSVVIALTGYNRTFKIMVEDKGTEIPEKELDYIQQDLKKSELSYSRLFSGKHENKGLLIAHAFARGLGKKPLAGINIKSNSAIGTNIWFFVENYANSPDSANLPEGVTRSSTRKVSYKPFRPSIFKMTFEYNSKDTVNSYSELNESVEVKSINIASFEKLSARGLNSYRNSSRDPLYSPQKYQIEIQKISESQDIILELPESISSRANSIVLISKDMEETKKFIEFCTKEGYNCVNRQSLEPLRMELQDRTDHVLMFLIDFDDFSDEDSIDQFQQIVGNTEAPFSVPIYGVRKFIRQQEGLFDTPREIPFIKDYLFKPFNEEQVSQFIKSFHF